MPVEIPRQNNYQTALDIAWEKLRTRPARDLEHLGATRDPDNPHRWLLPVLDASFHIDIKERTVTVSDATSAPPSSPQVAWQILALHYLLADIPVPTPASIISFEQIPEARGYASPYNGRVIGRFCSTVGRTRQSFLDAARALCAETVPGGDLSMRFVVFPLVPVTIVYYAGDDEFPPGASFLYEDVITAILPLEDIIVTAERLVSRLSGKPW